MATAPKAVTTFYHWNPESAVKLPPVIAIEGSLTGVAKIDA